MAHLFAVNVPARSGKHSWSSNVVEVLNLWLACYEVDLLAGCG